MLQAMSKMNPSPERGGWMSEAKPGGVITPASNPHPICCANRRGRYEERVPR
jgi:hypothetical protein